MPRVSKPGYISTLIYARATGPGLFRTIGDDGFYLGFVALLELDDGASCESGEHVGYGAGSVELGTRKG